MNPYRNNDLKKFIESIPQEEIDRQTKFQDDRNEQVYNEFIAALKVNKCFLCGGSMDSFEEPKPCFHWFTYPPGIRKKHFEKYLEKPIGFFQLDSYLRWLANTEKPFGNINDLKGETSKTSFIETTIRYKNIEWSFSIGHTDKEGHPGKQVGSIPHFHIQMLVDGRIFIKFGDFHIKFTDENLFILELAEQGGEKVKLGHSFGAGLGIIEDEKNLQYIEGLMTTTENAENASFNRQTIIEMPEGQTMSGEQIIKAIEESKRTKRPIGKILQEQFKDAKGFTIIGPGDGVPEMKKRSGKK